MFHLTRRLNGIMPLAWFLAGLLDRMPLMALPSSLVLGFLVARHRRIVRLVGSAPWASAGFARHVMVDELVCLAIWTAFSPLVHLLGHEARQMLVP